MIKDFELSWTWTQSLTEIGKSNSALKSIRYESLRRQKL